MKLQIPTSEINELYHFLEEKRDDDMLGLDKSKFNLLLCAVGTVVSIVEIVQKGVGIAAVRKLLNIFPVKEPNSGSNSNGNAGDQTDGSDDQSDGSDDPVDNDSGDQTDGSDDPVDGGANKEAPEVPESEGLDPNRPTADEIAKTSEDDKLSKGKLNQNHPGKSGVGDYPSAPKIIHDHPTLEARDKCPQCGKGKLYPREPRAILQFTGGPLVSPVIHQFNDLACNVCKAVFRVELSRELKDEGVGQGGQYTFSAIAMIGILKYFLCLPLYRSEMKGAWMGVKIPRSTAQDQIEGLVNCVSPIQRGLLKAAALAILYYTDDTTGKILTKKSELIPQRGTGKLILRDGRHSSVAIAIDVYDRPIVCVKTGILHAGEHLDSILISRPEGAKVPKIMWDRISSNTVTECDYIDLACLQHARDNFFQLLDQDPEFIKVLLSHFKLIFKNDKKTHFLNPTERLAYHQEHSISEFEAISEACKAALKNKVYLPNTELGKACNYFLKHQKELEGFLKYEGAPICNNLAERTISNLVLLRNVVHHFKNEMGAIFADTLWTVGLTAYYNHLNIFEYFKLVLANQSEVKSNPQYWFPWEVAKRYPELVLPESDRFHLEKLPSLKNPYQTAG